MNNRNGQDTAGGVKLIQSPVADETSTSNLSPQAPGPAQAVATQSKLRAREQLQQNRLVMIAGAGIVLAILLFVATNRRQQGPAESRMHRPESTAAGDGASSAAGTASGAHSVLPIIDSGRQTSKEGNDGQISEQDLDRTAVRRIPDKGNQTRASNTPGTVGGIPAFGGDLWQAPPYQPGTSNNTEAADLGKSERETEEKSSLVYVRSTATAPISSGTAAFDLPLELGLGLRTGTRLRARLESAASTAVRAPVLAVIEYTYERDGEIVVPAGAKAIGHIQQADRSGYMRIEFDSLLMPDGATVPIQAAASNLDLRPLKGRVEGKNIGKNVLVRSLSGIGQAGAIWLGRGNLNQPLSESDLIRERVSNNIGEVSDEQIAKMAITENLVVTVSAGTPIYVILEQTPKSSPAPAKALAPQYGSAATAEELRQLLQLQRELNAQNQNAQ